MPLIKYKTSVYERRSKHKWVLYLAVRMSFCKIMRDQRVSDDFNHLCFLNLCTKFLVDRIYVGELLLLDLKNIFLSKFKEIVLVALWAGIGNLVVYGCTTGCSALSEPFVWQSVVQI